MASNGNDELRRNWRNRWLSSIQEFADSDTQRRLWLDPTNTNPHYSFGEYYCCYFDDLNLSEGYGWAVDEGLIDRDEVQAVMEFHRVARAYHQPGTPRDNEAVLADPQWEDVVNAAKQAQT